MPVDQYDKSVGWTVQDGSLAEVDPEVNDPGMVYHRSQLPDPNVAKAAGIPPQPEPVGVYDDAAAALDDPNGPNVDDLHWIRWDDLKDKVKDAISKQSDENNKDEDVDTSPVAEDKPVDEKPADVPAEPEHVDAPVVVDVPAEDKPAE